MITKGARLHFLVAFVSRDQSRCCLELAVRLAVANQARITILKVLANPHAVGVVAELIATDEPFILANSEVQSVVDELISDELDVKAVVRKVDNVAEGIVSIAIELGVDMVFLGTRDVKHPSGLIIENDPIANYVLERCPANVVLVRERNDV
mgnify:CR=1 FL=1